MTFPRYPEYRDSGVEWLGEIPAHWEVKQLKRVVRMKSGEGITAEAIQDDGPYPVMGGNGLRGYSASFTHDGDYILIGRQGALCGNINFAKGRFWASEHAVVVESVVDADTAWLGELLRAMDLGQYSMSAAQPGLSVDALGRLCIPVPPRDEQVRISAFLSPQLAHIDALVAEQQRLIELLQEKRQAVISRAVTKGLNPDVPMKPSGVEWLGDVPAHWEVRPLKSVSTGYCDGPFGSGLKSSHYSIAGARVVRLQNIREMSFDDSDEAYIPFDYYAELGRHDVVQDDLLIAGLGDDNNIVGRACVAPAGIEPALVKADCFRFRLRQDLMEPVFVAAQLCAGARAEAGNLATGSTRSRISLIPTSRRRLAVPPVEEQSSIVAEIGKLDDHYSALIRSAYHSTALLRERRTTLISAAVTGKIDVRAHAPSEAA